LKRLVLIAAIFLGTACVDNAGGKLTDADTSNAETDAGSWNVETDGEPAASRGAVAAEDQRQGDPEAGYQYLIGGEYTGCGLPERVYSVAAQLGFLPNGEPAPVSDSDLPYFLSRFETENRETVVGPNCLTCHAGYVEGQLVVGAPGLDFDYGGLAQDAQRFKIRLCTRGKSTRTRKSAAKKSSTQTARSVMERTVETRPTRTS
jgi:hypothetical protein